MLKVIEDEGTIRRCQQQLVKSLRPFVDAKIPVRLGHPGANFPIQVSWSEQLGIWFCSRKTDRNRYWNAFGVQKPSVSAALSITCEINFPIRGVDRKMGGVLAEDGESRIFVVHRGKIGGGKRGIGKSLFEKHFRGAWATIEDGGEESTVALIGMLKSLRFPRQLSQFIRKVGRIKQQADLLSSAQLTIFDDVSPKEEFMGTRMEAAADMAALCDYGIVVKDLAELLAGRGLRVGNDSRRDLFVTDRRNRVDAMFQISTELSESGLSAGMARLLLDSLDQPEQPLLILVIPARPHAGLVEKLKKLHIEILPYEWVNDRAIFPGLDLLLPARC